MSIAYNSALKFYKKLIVHIIAKGILSFDVDGDIKFTHELINSRDACLLALIQRRQRAKIHCLGK